MKEKIIAIKRIAKSKRPLTLVTLILLFLFTVPAAIETSVVTAQGLKIQSISEIEEKAKESIDTIINIGKYVVSSALAIGLIFVVYALGAFGAGPRSPAGPYRCATAPRPPGAAGRRYPP